MGKPSTKLEHRVAELSEKLSTLSEKQIKYAKVNSFWKYFDISRNTIYCLECGHGWKDNVKKKRHRCPECNLQLKQIHEHKTWMRAQGYMMVIDRIKEFQVLRYLYINKWMRKGQEPRYDYSEVSQVFISPNGTVTIMGAERNPMGAYSSPQWRMGSKLSIKKHANNFYRNRYTEYYSCLYPSRKIIPELRRAGFKNSFYNQNPTEMVQGLLQFPQLETLLKRKEMNMFMDGVKHRNHIEDYWSEIKITFRNNYKIIDFGIWRDYINLLRYFEKDTLNPVFTCPENLNEAHDKWMNKKRRIIEYENRLQREREAQERREKEEYWKEHYPKIRQAFLDFSIKHEHITVEVIKSVQQLKEESELLSHCAYTNGYYDKQTSLLLSARVNNEVIETIEINLERMEIVQARGMKNHASPYNKEIVQLVAKNLPKIKRLYKKQLKMAS